MTLRQRFCHHRWLFYKMDSCGYLERCERCRLLQHIPS